MARYGITTAFKDARKSIAVEASPLAPPVNGFISWYDASRIQGVSDGTLLSSWADISGQGYSLTQGTMANQPTYYSTTSAFLVNGKPAVWFPGTAGACMIHGPGFNQGSLSQSTVMVVGRSTTIAQVNFTDGNGAGHDVAIGSTNTGANFEAYAGTLLNGTPMDTALHFFACTYNGASSTFYVDGGSFAGTTGGSQTLNFLLLGGGNTAGSALNLNGPICEVAVWPSALTSPQIATIRNYALHKWFTYPGPAVPRSYVTLQNAANI